MCQINRRSFLGSSAALIGGGFAAGDAARGQNEKHASGDAVSHHASALSPMTETANRFLATLSPEQRAKATFAFSDDERMDWHYIPKPRKGLPFAEMMPYQKHLASALLASGLSQAGYIKAVTIMSLEDVLRIMENDSGERRNPEKYYFSIFGTPADSGVWGWRVEGHHVSQNYTVRDGQAVDGPSFFGSNPAEVLTGPRRGLRVLSAEDDLGLALINALDDPLRDKAIVDAKAYADILSAASRKAALAGQPSGLSAAEMNAKHFEALRALMELYARNLSGELARRRMKQIDEAGRNAHFAWAGGSHVRDPHYYRIQTSAFLIEFDDTQDNANHIHSVWRDFGNDFGGDLLRAHYQTEHG